MVVLCAEIERKKKEAISTIIQEIHINGYKSHGQSRQKTPIR